MTMIILVVQPNFDDADNFLVEIAEGITGAILTVGVLLVAFVNAVAGERVPRGVEDVVAVLVEVVALLLEVE